MADPFTVRPVYRLPLSVPVDDFLWSTMSLPSTSVHKLSQSLTAENINNDGDKNIPTLQHLGLVVAERSPRVVITF